ncbi:hypothetical protein [Ornithinibacillus halophilus]|uniref:PH domain-containing protein n=1 Tax=Ornithinibacillus halophilus TaxID=930117 RepID=A0A1M5HPZ0_9BACI|nr:hypothetical protein [Ornithinibacillus halophilus]SHG18031.1 hypothetical protein SAMN05216225_10193 [Ornithinibacillus halophilus]
MTTYHSRSSNSILTALIVVGVLIARDYHLVLLIIPTILLLIGLLRLQVEIDEEIKITICFIRLPLFQKSVSAEKISSIKFTRAMWAKKRSVVKFKNGFFLFLTQYYPGDFYEKLMDFSSQYQIPVKKTKDFETIIRLERKKMNKEEGRNEELF